MRNIYEGKILPTCDNAVPKSGCICGLPEGHTDDHRCEFCGVTWTNQAQAKEISRSALRDVPAFLIARLEEEKAQRKANFVAWQAACATINRLLAEVAELKMLAEVAERKKLLSEAREGHLLRQLPRWKL